MHDFDVVIFDNVSNIHIWIYFAPKLPIEWKP